MRRRNQIAAALLSACLLALPAACHAQTTITVDDTGDPSSGTGGCTLRDAITIATGGSAASGDSCSQSGSGTPYSIEFSVTGTITLSSLLPAITTDTDLTITGPTTSSSGIIIDGNHNYRIMEIDSGATVDLQYLTLQHGGTSGGRANILNNGTLTITNCTLLDNESHSGIGLGAADGGAISNDGTLTIADSTLSSNLAIATFSSASGGAIANFSALTITNTTFSANQAEGQSAGEGGAISNLGTLTITNATFSGNQAVNLNGSDGFGGAIINFGTAHLKGTIVADSLTSDNCTNLTAASDEGYNLSSDSSCGFSKTGSANNGINIDPMLAALADNGGPTQTFALKTGSPAIDAIPHNDCTDQASPTPNQLTTDQRGFLRPDPEDGPDGPCDIGAYESGAIPPLAGQPGTANCQGIIVAALAHRYGGIKAAAAALKFPSVKALQAAISQFCAG